MIWGSRKIVTNDKNEMMERFDCDDVGDVIEYVGCKIEQNLEKGWTKITQPVMIQSFGDEFKIKESRKPKTPAEAGTMLTAASGDTNVKSAEHTTSERG